MIKLNVSDEVLANIMVQAVEFAYDFYRPNPIPWDDRNVLWVAAYQCTCFLANNTVRGHGGVELKIPYVELKINKEIPYEDRLQLARALIQSFQQEA